VTYKPGDTVLWVPKDAMVRVVACPHRLTRSKVRKVTIRACGIELDVAPGELQACKPIYDEKQQLKAWARPRPEVSDGNG